MRLSRQTRAIVQNVAFSLAIKAVFLLALAGVATLWMAVFADVGASLLVILNGMRLLRAKPAAWRLLHAINRPQNEEDMDAKSMSSFFVTLYPRKS